MIRGLSARLTDNDNDNDKMSLSVSCINHLVNYVLTLTGDVKRAEVIQNS